MYPRKGDDDQGDGSDDERETMLKTSNELPKPRKLNDDEIRPLKLHRGLLLGWATLACGLAMTYAAI